MAVAPVPRAGPVLLAVPANLTIQYMGETYAWITWTYDGSGPLKFIVERSSDGTNFVQIMPEVYGTQWTDNSLTCETNYTYRVRAFLTGSVLSDPSNEATGRTSPCGPSSLRANPVGNDRIDLQWQDNSKEESGFRVLRCNYDPQTGNCSPIPIATVAPNITTYVDNGLACATTYRYHVRAYRNTDGRESSFSAPAETTTGGCVAATFTPTPSPTVSATTTATSTPVTDAIPTETQTATASPTVTASLTPFVAAAMTDTPTPETPTTTATPLASVTSTPTTTPSPSSTVTGSPTSTATESPTSTATESPTSTVTGSPTSTNTVSPTSTTTSPTHTATVQIGTPTGTATGTPSVTSTVTPSPSLTPTPTHTPTLTPTPKFTYIRVPNIFGFDDTPLGGSSLGYLNLYNNGPMPNPISVKSLIIDPPDEFEVQSPREFPQTIDPGQSLMVTLLFTPASLGFKTATLRVYSDAANGEVGILLMGTGVQVTATPTQTPVTGTPVVTVTPTRTLTVTPTGTVTGTLTATPTQTATEIPVPTPGPTDTPEGYPGPTEPPPASPTATETMTSTVTATHTASPTATEAHHEPPPPPPPPSDTPVLPTAIPSPTQTRPLVRFVTRTPARTTSPTVTRTGTATATLTATETQTATTTLTATPTETETLLPAASPTYTPPATFTLTPEMTPLASATPRPLATARPGPTAPPSATSTSGGPLVRASVRNSPAWQETLQEKYFMSIPTLPEVSRQLSVITTNLLLAILLALTFGTFSALLNNTLEAEEQTLRGWLSSLGPVRWFNEKTGGILTSLHGSVTSLEMPDFVVIGLILLLYGAVFAFLDPDFRPFSLSGLLLLVTMILSVGLVSLVDDLATWWLLRRWNIAGDISVYPSNLLLAAMAVSFSRVFSLIPGIVFGSPGGIHLEDRQGLSPERIRRLTLVGLGSVAGVALIAWLGSLGTAALDAMGAGTTPLAPIIVTVQNLCLLVFLAALSTLFFDLIPISYNKGRDLFDINKIIWGVVFTATAFLVVHLLINPNSGFLDAFLNSNVRTLIIVVGAFSAFTLEVWAYFRWRHSQVSE